MTSVDLIDYHEKNQYPSHKRAIAGLFIVFGGFIALGLYSLYNLWQAYDITGIIASIWPDLANNLWWIGAALGGIIIMCIGVALGASILAKRLGGTLIYIGAGLMNIMTWGIPILLLVTGMLPLANLLAAWPVLIPGIFTLFITLLLFTVWKENVRRAGEIIKLTGQVTLDAI